MNIREDKERLRASIKERLKHVSTEDRVREGRSLCKRLIEALPQTPGTICVFYPMESEVDISPLFPILLERGWKVFFPRFEGSSFAFRQVDRLELLVPGRYGLMEPSKDEEPLTIEDVTLALLPGIAFDREGRRLGRGNGGFDIWLKKLRGKNPNALVWGIALDSQIVQDVPMEPHDQRVDRVCTARGFVGE